MGTSLGNLMLIAPTVVTLVVQGLAAAVCFWAWRETQLRGWRLLGAASAVRIVGSLPHFFTINLFSGGDYAAVARWYWVIGVADWASTIVASLLFLGGLYVLADGVRRLRAPAIEQPPMQRYSP